jgi:hypothetical protein
MAGTSILQAPPPDLHRQRLDIVTVRASDLVRVSRHETGEPYFGRTGGHRFDDSCADPAQRFGTCYLGLGLTVAFAESVLHDLESRGGKFVLPVSEIDGRYVLSFKGRALRLANGRLRFVAKAVVVPRAGIEPARPCDQRILSPVCLPISPPGHRARHYAMPDR